LRDGRPGAGFVEYGLCAGICALYKARWQVELFFKWIKQHLRIKIFFGAPENAVKAQIWTAVSVYVLVAIVMKRLNLDVSLDFATDFVRHPVREYPFNHSF
jgi:IS4 transposase